LEDSATTKAPWRWRRAWAVCCSLLCMGGVVAVFRFAQGDLPLSVSRMSLVPQAATTNQADVDNLATIMNQHMKLGRVPPFQRMAKWEANQVKLMRALPPHQEGQVSRARPFVRPAVAAPEAATAPVQSVTTQSVMGLYGLGVMGQNFALNVASKGFQISVANRGPERVDTCLSRAEKEGLQGKVVGFKDLESFVESLEVPRRVMFLVKAGQAVDDAISMFADLLSPGDILIDGGNEWFENSERRAAKVLEQKGIMYLAMGVSGGEFGARYGPSLMPGGPKEAYDALEPVLKKVAAQSDSGPCVTYLGAGGCGNYVKMVHNGIEYGDMQIIAEAYDLLRNNGFSNDEIGGVFEDFNGGELQSYLMEISAKILKKKDEDVIAWADGSKLPSSKDSLVDMILDATGNKGTGKMTVQQAAAQGVAVPTIAAALDARFLSSCKEERLRASEVLKSPEQGTSLQEVDREQLVQDVRNAMYSSKIISYAQGMNLIKAASNDFGWDVNLGEAARIWKEGCIIRAQFLDRIKAAYDKDPLLPSLLLDEDFARELGERQASWRRAVILSMNLGVTSGAMAASLAYYDQYRRALLPANLVQAQRDFFGSHTFERLDKDRGEYFHCLWDETHAEETGKR